MDIMNSIAKVFSLWCIVLPAIFFGCLIGNSLQGTRIWSAFARLMAPLSSRLGLPYYCGMYLVLCSLNHYSANSFLGIRFRERKLREGQLLVAFLVGGFLTALHFAIFYIAPILIAACGWLIGITYAFIYLIVNLLPALIGALIGILGAKNNILPLMAEHGATKFIYKARSKKEYKTILITSLKEFRRIAIVFIPITFGFTLALHSEYLQPVLKSLDPLLLQVGLSAPMLIIVMTGMTSSIAALAAVGPIYKGHLLEPLEIFISLLIAYGLHTIYEFFIHHLPSNIAFFGPQNGLRVSIVNNLLRLLSISIICGLIFLLPKF